MALREFSGDAAAAKLQGAMSGSPTQFSVDNATGFPTGTTAPFVVVVDRGLSTEEKILIASRSGATFTMAQRGYDGTIQVDHGDQAPVEHCLDAATIAEVNAHVNKATRDDHSQYLNTTRHDLTARHGASVVSHGSIGGLTAGDDHTQYMKADGSRHDLTARHGATVVTHGAIGGLTTDDHTQYMLATGSRHDLTARHGASVVLHGSIGGLSGDDHTQYALASGARAITGSQQINGFLAIGGAHSASNPELKVKRLNGTLDGSGNVTVAHGLSLPAGAAVGAFAFCKGNSGEAVAVTNIVIDGGNVFLTGGIASRSYYVTLLYSDDTVGTW